VIEYELAEELIDTWNDSNNINEVVKRLRIFLNNFKDEIMQNKVFEKEDLSEAIKFIRGGL